MVDEFNEKKWGPLNSACSPISPICIQAVLKRHMGCSSFSAIYLGIGPEGELVLAHPA